MKCWVCDEQYYGQTSLEPAEPCLCSEGISSHQTHTWRAWLLRIGYRAVHLIWNLGGWLPVQMQKLTLRWERFL
jgi:hypothetical protein